MRLFVFEDNFYLKAFSRSRSMNSLLETSDFSSSREVLLVAGLTHRSGGLRSSGLHTFHSAVGFHRHSALSYHLGLGRPSESVEKQSNALPGILPVETSFRVGWIQHLHDALLRSMPTSPSRHNTEYRPRRAAMVVR